MNNIKAKNELRNKLSRSQRKKSLHQKYMSKITSHGMVNPGRTYQEKREKNVKSHRNNSYTKAPRKESTNVVKKSIPLENVADRMAQPQMQIHSVPVTAEHYAGGNNKAGFIRD